MHPSTHPPTHPPTLHAQVCDSRTLCPAALELLRASAARGAAGRKGEPPPPELLAKLLATLTSGDDDGGAEVRRARGRPVARPVALGHRRRPGA